MASSVKTKSDFASSSIKFYNYHEYVLHTAEDQVEELGYSLPPPSADAQQPTVLLTHFQNPYTTSTSPSSRKTRIIRIPREFHTHGDLIPQFSTYFPGEEPGALAPPEIAKGKPTDNGEDGGGEVESSQIQNATNSNIINGFSSISPLKLYISAQELAGIVQTINKYLQDALSPYTFRNMADFLLNMTFCWLLEVFREPYSKKRLKELEEYIQEVNKDLEFRGKQVRFISPLRSGYLSVCILSLHYFISNFFRGSSKLTFSSLMLKFLFLHL